MGRKVQKLCETELMLELSVKTSEEVASLRGLKYPLKERGGRFMCKAKMWFLRGLFSILIILLIGWIGEVQAQIKFPTRAITIVVPVPPGGGTDLVNRMYAASLSKRWGVPVNVVNKGGGITLPATVEIYQTPPDGYTVFGDNTNTVMLTIAVKNLPIEILDRTFICKMSGSPMIAVVHPNSSFKSLKDLEDEVKKNPGDFSYAYNGGGGVVDLTQRKFFKAIGFDYSKTRTRPVNIQSGAQTAQLVAGGHIKMGFLAAGSGASAIHGGLVKGLSVAAKNRMTTFPNIPTTAEQGFPTLLQSHWQGISGPPNIPSNIVDIWEEALQGVLKDPEVISKLINIGEVPNYVNRHEFRESVKNEIVEVNQLLGTK
jgi:tripartite-type tricarboxylate transporter receptor subunit TctC